MLLKAGVKIEDVAGGIINRLPDREVAGQGVRAPPVAGDVQPGLIAGLEGVAGGIAVKSRCQRRVLRRGKIDIPPFRRVRVLIIE